MQFSYIEEFLRLLFLFCNKNPELFVAFFNQSDFLIGYNYRPIDSKFTHVSNSFRRILGYDLTNILNNSNFATKIIHPHDNCLLNEYLNIVPDSCIDLSDLTTHYEIKRTKYRAKHIRGYWKYFIIFSMNYRNSNANTIDKIGLIADAHIKPHLQIIKKNYCRPINTVISEETLNFQESNEHKVMISSRESEILELISEGMVGKEIAEKLNISLSTIITHRKHLISKFDVHNTAELIKKATNLMLI